MVGSDSKQILLMGSTKRDSPIPVRFRMRIPKFDKYFSGTGDTFAALLTAWTARGVDVITACERTVNAIHAILVRTMKDNSTELKLIQSKTDIEHPQILIKAEVIK